MSEHFVVGVKEALTIAIDEALSDGIKNGLTSRKLAERAVVILADFTQKNAHGPTGQFPEGKLDATDQGELKLFISGSETDIRLDFGKLVAWIAFPKAQALTFCFTILEHCGVKIEHKIQQDPAPGEPA